MKILITVVMSSLVLGHSPNEDHYLIAGTYDSPLSDGIHVYRFSNADGSVSQVGSIKTGNPSYLTVSPSGNFVYAVNENGKDDMGGEVSAFSFNRKDGKLTFLNKVLSGGDHPCYVEIDRTGKWLFAGNYSSGSFSVFPVKDDGRIGDAVQTIRHEGSGVNKKRQEKPHVHCTALSPDNRWLFVPDLGIDKVMIYAFDETTGKVTPGSQPSAPSVPGSGPRHLVFHPNNKSAYLVEELTGTIVTFGYQEGVLRPAGRADMVSPGFSGAIGAADIHISPDGRFLYATNRGDANEIVIFRIDDNGSLAFAGRRSVLGRTPRNFNFDPSGRYLLVANQDSNEIVIFSRDITTGMLEDTGKRISLGKPVCIKWIKP